MNNIVKSLLLIILAVTTFQAQAAGGSLGLTELAGLQNSLSGKLPSKQVLAKIGGDLWVLHSEYQAYLQRASVKGASAKAFKSRNPLVRTAAGSLFIHAAASGDPEALASDLHNLGVQKVTVFGHMFSGLLPISAIPALKELSSLQFARPAYALTNAGAVTSQGDAAMRTNLARSAFDVDGTGVTVGVLSDSYNCLGGASAGVASGELPANVVVLSDLTDSNGSNLCVTADRDGTDEGRALMEVIHDVAPGAGLFFHTAFGPESQPGFAKGIIALANAGAKVITDDIVYLDEPFYQDGIVAQAVDVVKAMGVAYFSAAFNADRNAYESEFRPSGKFFDGSEMHDFNPGSGVNTCQKITIPSGAELILDFQWDQPFFSVSGAPGSASDMDIIVTYPACKSPLFWSNDDNLHGDPIEALGIINSGPKATVGIWLTHLSGPKPGKMKMVNFGIGSKFAQFKTNSATIFGHSNSRGGLSVGAVDYRKTPTFGVKKPLIERYSSAGGTPILFDTAGSRLVEPEIRDQPAVAAPDGVDTSFFGVDTKDEGSAPNFFGTSASTAHATGVAALLKALDPTLTPDETYAWMKAGALDMNDPGTRGFDTGFDYVTGFGLIQAVADLAVVKISAPATVKGTGAVTKTVNVTIQSRSPYNEIITTPDLGDGIATGLVRLNVNGVDDDGENCAAAAIVLDAARTLKKGAIILKPKQNFTVVYNVTYHCPGVLAIKNDATPQDYSHFASVYHEVLDEIPDAHPDDDSCPRSIAPPFEVDLYPDGKIKDRGCGAKKADKTFGNPVVTDIKL